MQLNDIFLEKDYDEAFDYIIKNDFLIKEIEKNAQGERQFKIVEKPLPTEKELNTTEYFALKQQLADMDYKTSKYADGEYTQEEWAEIVAERKSIRERIRELEKLI